MDLPKEEHRRGGDPELALQFARRPQLEKRYEYFLRMAKLASKFFINPSTGQPNVSGLIMAEAAGFKTELSQLKRFDDRLRTKILNAVDFWSRFGSMGGILSYQLEDDKEKKVTIDFEAFGPVNALLYPLHLVFQTEAPKELESDNKIGFIVTDGDVALLGTRSGNTLEVLHKFSAEIVERRKEHERGEPLSAC
ncbi:hypothetical protein CRG98_013995 [Punica granatum]|uniref:Uncharacterized protein n=1 Tax=Punica granatum TaxID=22663 RepID=A0A2I0KAP5_PUNGR|nr:hypothetical protein CRG98_013995 [Punica granatum]